MGLVESTCSCPVLKRWWYSWFRMQRSSCFIYPWTCGLYFVEKPAGDHEDRSRTTCQVYFCWIWQLKEGQIKDVFVSQR
jgi:hypothetical protein